MIKMSTLTLTKDHRRALGSRQPQAVLCPCCSQLFTGAMSSSKDQVLPQRRSEDQGHWGSPSDTVWDTSLCLWTIPELSRRASAPWTRGHLPVGQGQWERVTSQTEVSLHWGMGYMMCCRKRASGVFKRLMLREETCDKGKNGSRWYKEEQA